MSPSWGERKSLLGKSDVGAERAQALEEACANTGGGPQFRFMVSSPLERLVSRSGMLMLLMGLATIVQAAVSGLSADERIELQLYGSFLTWKPYGSRIEIEPRGRELLVMRLIFWF